MTDDFGLVKVAIHHPPKEPISLSYRIGRPKCIHGDYMCVQFDIMDLPMPKSDHHSDPATYSVSMKDVAVSNYKPGDFLHNIRSLWGGLVFRRVKRNIVRLEDLEYVRRYRHRSPPEDLTNQLNIEQLTQFISDNDNIRAGYSYYYGFAEPMEGSNISIFFRRPTNSCLSFDGNNIGCWIRNNSRNPPKDNQLLCGLIGKYKNRIYYRNWFKCSDQFYRLYILIMYGRNHELFTGKNDKQILDMLETNIELKKIAPPNEKEKAYKCLDVESTAIKYCDVYKAIALLFVLQDERDIQDRNIPKTYWLPTNPTDFKHMIMSAFG